ncbi:MAG: hypothetical protein ACRD3P_16440 [Terriglobales bacterium]
MSFHRSNGGQKISASQVFFRLVLIAVIAGESFGQSPHSRRISREPSAKEISRYLVSRDLDPADVKAEGAPTLSVSAIVEKIMVANARRLAELRGFEGKRWYHLDYHGLFGGRSASMEVLATYTAPDLHNFTVLSQSGSKLLLNRVLLKLLASEKEAFQNHKQVELSPENYKFTLLGTEKIPEGDTCYVLTVKPLKPNKFLYDGKIWVDAHDFAIVRMEGEPAKAPSFWVRDTQIDSSWEKVGGFWFIAHNHSVSHIRMGGVATLNIDYGDYQVTAVNGRAGKTQAQGPVLPEPASVAPQR